MDFDTKLVNHNSPNFLAIQSEDDSMMGFGKCVPFVKKISELTGGKAQLSAYTWGDHQPSQQTDFFWTIETFIRNPRGFKPAKDSEWKPFHTGSVDTDYQNVPQKKACLTNNDGIKPLKHMHIDVWGGKTGYQTCQGACNQVQGCTYFDLLTPRTRFTEEDGIDSADNCILYTKQCTKPTYSKTSTYGQKAKNPYKGQVAKAYCNGKKASESSKPSGGGSSGGGSSGGR